MPSLWLQSIYKQEHKVKVDNSKDSNDRVAFSTNNKNQYSFCLFPSLKCILLHISKETSQNKGERHVTSIFPILSIVIF